MRYNNSCVNRQRISQNTVLAMLQAPSVSGINVGDRVEYTNDSGRSIRTRVAAVGRDTVDLEIDGEVVKVDKSKIKTNDLPVFLDKVKKEDWKIVGFDNQTRIVCIEIDTPHGLNHVSITLPIVEIRNS